MFRLLALYGKRHGVASAQTESRNSAMHVASLHLIQQRHKNPRAGP